MFLCLGNSGLLAQYPQDSAVYIDSVLGRKSVFVVLDLVEVLRLAHTGVVDHIVRYIGSALVGKRLALLVVVGLILVKIVDSVLHLGDPLLNPVDVL